MRLFHWQKYRLALIGGSFFLVILGLKTLSSAMVKEQTSQLNSIRDVIQRQSLLLRRTQNSLYDAYMSFKDSKLKSNAINSAQRSSALFTKTLSSLSSGGAVVTPEGSVLELKEPDEHEVRVALNEIGERWRPYYLQLKPLGLGADPSSDGLQELIEYGNRQTPFIQDYFDTVSLEMTGQIQNKFWAKFDVFLNWLLALSFLALLLTGGFFFRSRGDAKYSLDEVQQLLNGINEGVFLLDESFDISEPCSPALEKIFNEPRLVGISFSQLLGAHLDSKELAKAQEFFHHLFSPYFNDHQIKKHNPLKAIKIRVANEKNNYIDKYLNFSFSREFNSQMDRVTRVFVAVTDVTEHVKISHQIKQERHEKLRDFDILSGLVKVDHEVVEIYLTSSYESFFNIKKILKTKTKSKQQYTDKINELLSLLHNFKGESAAVDLQQFVNIAQNIESHLEQLRSRKQLQQKDFYPIIAMTNTMIGKMESVRKVVSRVYKFSNVKSMDITDINKQRNWQHLFNLSKKISKQQDKQVKLVLSGFEDVCYSDKLYKTINTILVQLLRNAISHGIESVQQRLDIKKPAVGRINIDLKKRGNGFLEITLSDNGAGIDVDKVRRVALKKNIIDVAQAKSLTSNALISLIFDPDFSTRDKIDENAGRGIGMYAVKQLVKQWGGKISVTSKSRQGCSFTVQLMHNEEPVKEVA